MTPWWKEYTTQVLEAPTIWGVSLHLIIRRHDGREIQCNWSTIQEIKNEILGEDVLAIELYPAETDVVNEVPYRHLWTVPDERLAVGFHPRKHLR